ncbi:YjfK family protein, partial [Alteromonas sp. MCA-1]
MFSKLFKKSEPKKPKSPEIMGLYLGGSFELDNLKPVSYTHLRAHET